MAGTQRYAFARTRGTFGGAKCIPALPANAVIYIVPGEFGLGLLHFCVVDLIVKTFCLFIDSLMHSLGNAANFSYNEMLLLLLLLLANAFELHFM